MASYQLLLSVIKNALYSLFVLSVISSVTHSLPSKSETYESAADQSSSEWAKSQGIVEARFNKAQEHYFEAAESQEEAEAMINQAHEPYIEAVKSQYMAEAMINQAQEPCGFGCSNDKCLSQSQRCDLVRNCYDDEFKCLIHDKGNVLYLKNNIYIPVCVNHLNKSSVIKMCQFLGKGPATRASWRQIGNGIVFLPKNGTLLNFIPANVQICRLLNLTCARRDCGKRVEHLDGLVREGSLDGQFPWQAIVITNHTKRCVGTLVNETIVLVAGHCVKGATSVSVLLGSVNGQTQNHRAQFIRFYKSKSYSEAMFAKVVLRKEVQMNDFVQAACLPSKRWVPNTECFITGWRNGDDENVNNLKISKVKILTEEACMRQYPFVRGRVFVCAKADEGKPSGYGESDGPLVCQNEFGYFSVVGVLAKKQNGSRTNPTSSLFVSLTR